MLGPTGPTQCIVMVDWTTTNMDYGSFYQQSMDRSSKFEIVASQVEGDIHAECKRQLEAIRKELEECRAQVRLHQNSNTLTSTSSCIAGPAERHANTDSIRGEDNIVYQTDGNKVSDAPTAKLAARPTVADHLASRRSKYRGIGMKVGSASSNVQEAAINSGKRHKSVLPARSSRIRQTCSFSTS
ncbi:hypothetical protein L7F22_001195 [Adiantum nelumboides]|nr:hypothetical protein [Adiantum nelumboides]